MTRRLVRELADARVKTRSVTGGEAAAILADKLRRIRKPHGVIPVVSADARAFREHSAPGKT